MAVPGKWRAGICAMQLGNLRNSIALRVSAAALVWAMAALPAACAGAPPDTLTLRIPADDLPKLARIEVLNRTDYGAFSIVKVRPGAVDVLKAAKARFQEEKAAGLVGLQGHEFDVRTGPPAPPPGLAAKPTPGAPTLYLIHAAGPAKPDWIQEIERAGGNIVGYIPQYNYLVWIDPARLPALDRATFITWKGIYHPAYKISRALDGARGRLDYLAVSIYDPTGETVDKISSLGANVVRETVSPFSQGAPLATAIVSADASLIPKIAALPRVIRVEKTSMRAGLDDEVACQIVSGHRLDGIPYANPSYRSWLQQIGFDGTGSTIAIVDTGCDTNNNGTAHPDLRGRLDTIILYPNTDGTDISGHGTHVAGIAAGSPTAGCDDEGFLYGMGVAPACRLVIQNAVATHLSFPPVDWATLTADSVRSGAFASNNSWKTSNYPGMGYSYICQTLDALARDADTVTVGDQPLAMVFSSGNGGPAVGTMLEPKEAKNVITVGSSENYRPGQTLGPDCGQSEDIDAVAGLSSRGPCVDGRLAPTLVAPGTNIASAASSAATGWGTGCTALINSSYAWMSGTSMSAPMATGALAVIAQWWRADHGGANPSPAMCKAILINGADDIAGGPDGRGGYLDHIPNGDQGWGRLNLAAAVSPPDTFYEDQAFVLTQSGQQRSYRVETADPAKPLKITLVWTDAPGAPGAYAWTNDLDLVVTGESGTYLGNVFQSGWSTVGGNRNYKNNVECVYIRQPSGAYMVDVIAANLVADGIPGKQGSTDQDYAIVIRNGIVGGQPLMPYSPVDWAAPPHPDRYHMDVTQEGWSALALRPTPGADHDLAIYSEPAYRDLAASSTIRGSGVDLIAINGAQVFGATLYPLVSPYLGAGGYQLEWATSSGDLAPGTPDSRTFSGSDFLRAWEIEVDGSAECGLRVSPTSGDLDVAFCIFGVRPGAPTDYQTISTSIVHGDTGGPGQPETQLFNLPEMGRYSVVAWGKSSGGGSYLVLFDSNPPTSPVVTPSSKYTADLTRLSASWSASDPETAIAKYEYCIGTSPGSNDAAGWTDAGTSTSVTRTGLSLVPDQSYYFTVRATNGLGMASQGSSAPVLAVRPMPDIGSAKNLPDDAAVLLTSKTTSAAFSGRFYIEESDRSSAIGVLWQQTVPEGRLATVAGKLVTIDGERLIEAVAAAVQ